MEDNPNAIQWGSGGGGNRDGGGLPASGEGAVALTPVQLQFPSWMKPMAVTGAPDGRLIRNWMGLPGAGCTAPGSALMKRFCVLEPVAATLTWSERVPENAGPPTGDCESLRQRVVIAAQVSGFFNETYQLGFPSLRHICLASLTVC